MRVWEGKVYLGKVAAGPAAVQPASRRRYERAGWVTMNP
jgi:hypothetical protein